MKVSSTHGLSPNAFQMRLTVGCDIPVAVAIRHVDQCAASASSIEASWVRGSRWRC
jgi:hypothetical protein